MKYRTIVADPPWPTSSGPDWPYPVTWLALFIWEMLWEVIVEWIEAVVGE